MKAITTRICDIKDDIRAVIDLIIATDDYIYPPMFSVDAQERYSFFEACMKDERSAFYYKNIWIALEEEKVVGILVAFHNECTLLSTPTDRFAGRKEIAYCNTHYFQPLFLEYAEKPNVTYISNLCVAPECRGKGIGKRLLADFLRSCEGTVELDVLCDNPSAIRLYQSCGFSILYREDAFAFEPIPNFQSYRMQRC